MKNTILFSFILPLIFFNSQAQGLVELNNVVIGTPINLSPRIQLNIPSKGDVNLIGSNPYITFYKNGTWKGYIQNINNSLEIGTKNFNDIKLKIVNLDVFFVSGSTGESFIYQTFYANEGLAVIGKIGVGTVTDFGSIGQALKSSGSLVGQNPYYAKFNPNPSIGFRAKKTSNFSIASGATTNLGVLSSVFNDAEPPSGPNTPGLQANGDYKAGSAGLYHFDVSIPYFEWTGNTSGTIYIDLLQNNIKVQTYTQRFGSFGSSVIAEAINCSFDLKANGFDVFKIQLYQENNLMSNVLVPSASVGSDQQTVVSGFKVY